MLQAVHLGAQQEVHQRPDDAASEGHVERRHRGPSVRERAVGPLYRAGFPRAGGTVVESWVWA
ncbi:Uncharacterised protein [Mycobacteroides abscessus subsp. abscessus]|nr:Uncharacterised protein [Mycobacteroides abscessus subsp. abscessus]